MEVALGWAENVGKLEQLGFSAPRSRIAMKYLYLAYAATWTIHLAYIRYLSGRYRRLRQDAKELGKD
jgi:hypothetical protein